MWDEHQVLEARGKLLALDRSQAVIQFDLTGHVVEANENFLRLFEYEHHEIRGRHHSVFCESGYVESDEYRALWAKLAEGGRDAGQYKRISRSGRPVWIQSSYNPILDRDGRPIKVIKFATDISEQKAAEQALNEAKRRTDEALRSRELFLSTMSHELRTPMNVIIGLGQLMLDDPTLQAEHREQLDDIVKAGGHLLLLINDVLDLTQVESGMTTLRCTTVDARTIIHEAVSMLEVLAKSRQVTIQSDSVERGFVHADPFRLKQVIVNLVSNAVKYNRSQGLVRVRPEVLAKTLRISVTDTGHGIPQSRMAELFQPFNRLGAEQTAVEGTGIGLSICKRMIEAMSGAIGVESVEGEGSRFWVELPLAHLPASSDPTPRSPAGAPLAPAVPVGRRHHVLVAEDHVVNQKLIRRQLEMLGYDCTVTSNGVEAETALRAGQFDLLLSDLNMPVMDGYTLASRIRASGIGPSTLPIVFLTADVFNAEQDRWKTVGGDAYLTKPTQIDALSACLRDLLRTT